VNRDALSAASDKKTIARKYSWVVTRLEMSVTVLAPGIPTPALVVTLPMRLTPKPGTVGGISGDRRSKALACRRFQALMS